MPPVFSFQRGCGSLGASTDKTYFHADRLFNFQINGWTVSCGRLGNRLPFPPKTKNNFSGIDISQPTPWMSLSVPSFSLDNKLNQIKHSAQLVTLSAQRLAYGSMPLELAETRPRSNFSESRNAFSKVRSAKLNTDVKILMPGADYFSETALKQDIYLSTPCGNHRITHFRCTGSGLHSNLNSQQNHTFFADR